MLKVKTLSELAVCSFSLGTSSVTSVLEEGIPKAITPPEAM